MTTSMPEPNYTLLFTCSLSLSIPCTTSSPDVGKTISIDKVCPQCAPDPHLLRVISDQEHYDAVQKPEHPVADYGTPSILGLLPPMHANYSKVSLLSAPEDERSIRSSRSTRNLLGDGFRRLKRAVKGERVREETARGTAISGPLERRPDDRDEAEENRYKGKEREVKEKLDEVERELAMERAETIEKSLKVLS